jgi:hypothetical protein
MMIDTNEMRKFVGCHIENEGWGARFGITPCGIIAYLDEIDRLTAVNRETKQQLDIATDLGEKRFRKAKMLRERCAELEARLDLYTGNVYDLVVSENERLRAELEECHVLIDKVLDNRSEGMCTGDSSLSHRLSELVSYYQSMNAELAQLKEADRWIPVFDGETLVGFQHDDDFNLLPPAPDVEAK